MKRAICIFLATFCLSLPWALADGLRLTTIVIDAGHGGKDPGAVSGDRKTYEKTLALDIAKNLKTKINAAYPDVTVILTRDTDKYITLDGRAERANKASADLFLSIHINSSASVTANGYSVHILGQSSNKNKDLFAYNMDVCKAENSVIMLEEDYNTKYQGFDPSDPESYIFMVLMQNSHLEQSLRFAELIKDNLKSGPIKANRGIWQNPFYVLWKTAMPSVLVELGFISNRSDLSVLSQKSKRDEIASRLFAAFSEYKAIFDSSTDSGTETTVTEDSLQKKKQNDEKVVKVQTRPSPQKNSSIIDTQKPSTETKNADTSNSSVAPKESKEQASLKPESQKEKPLVEPSKNAEAKRECNIQYGVQIFVLTRDLKPSDPLFLGKKSLKIPVGKVYKYIIAIEADLEQTRRQLPEIKKKYTDAFLVRIEGENVYKIK